MKREMVPKSWVGRVWEGYKHEKEFGCFMVPMNGEGRAKTTHEKGVGCFMVHKSGVGRAWEGKKRSMKKGLSASWFISVGWEGSGKAQIEA